MPRTDVDAGALAAVTGDPVASRSELAGVMGCRGSVTVVLDEHDRRAAAGADRLLTVAEWRLRELEARWSRFLPDSELTLLGARSGHPVPVSEPTRTLVRALVDAWEATGGTFDPTRLPELVAEGYPASVLDPSARTQLPDHAVSGYDPTTIEIDEDGGTVTLPVGGTLDPGGLGKGLAADLVVAELLDRGAAGAMVEIGGDLRVAGRSPSGPAWRIDVEDPHATTATRLAVVEIVDGGVATSSRLLRTWPRPDGSVAHHLIDPRSGRPAAGDVVAATVVSATGAWSEAFAKVPLVRGADAARELLDAESIAALLVLDDGTVVTSPTWHDVAEAR